MKRRLKKYLTHCLKGFLDSILINSLVIADCIFFVTYNNKNYKYDREVTFSQSGSHDDHDVYHALQGEKKSEQVSQSELDKRKICLRIISVTVNINCECE